MNIWLPGVQGWERKGQQGGRCFLKLRVLSAHSSSAQGFASHLLPNFLIFSLRLNRAAAKSLTITFSWSPSVSSCHSHAWRSVTDLFLSSWHRLMFTGVNTPHLPVCVHVVSHRQIPSTCALQNISTLNYVECGYWGHFLGNSKERSLENVSGSLCHLYEMVIIRKKVEERRMVFTGSEVGSWKKPRKIFRNRESWEL